MTAPLAPFLKRFSAPPPDLLQGEVVVEVPAIPLISLTLDELNARVEAARHEAAQQAAERYAKEAATAAQAHWAEMDAALTAARADWCASEGERLASLVDTASMDLRALLTDRIAAVLCPWLAETVRLRARQGMIEALDRLLADETARSIRVSGPDDLVSAIRDARPSAAVDWQIADTVDVTVVADTTRLETRLAAALPDLVKEV